MDMSACMYVLVVLVETVVKTQVSGTCTGGFADGTHNTSGLCRHVMAVVVAMDVRFVMAVVVAMVVLDVVGCLMDVTTTRFWGKHVFRPKK